MSNSLRVTSIQLTVMIICIINVILCAIIFESILFSDTYKDYIGDDKRCLSREWCSPGNLAIQTIKILFLIVIIILFFWCISTIKNYDDSITIIQETNCSVDYTNKLFDEHSDTLLAGNDTNTGALLLTGIALLITVLLAVTGFTGICKG